MAKKLVASGDLIGLSFPLVTPFGRSNISQRHWLMIVFGGIAYLSPLCKSLWVF